MSSDFLCAGIKQVPDWVSSSMPTVPEVVQLLVMTFSMILGWVLMPEALVWFSLPAGKTSGVSKGAQAKAAAPAPATPASLPEPPGSEALLPPQGSAQQGRRGAAEARYDDEVLQWNYRRVARLSFRKVSDQQGLSRFSQWNWKAKLLNVLNTVNHDWMEVARSRRDWKSHEDAWHLDRGSVAEGACTGRCAGAILEHYGVLGATPGSWSSATSDQASGTCAEDNLARRRAPALLQERAILEHYGVLGATPGSWSSASSDEESGTCAEDKLARRRVPALPKVDRVSVGILSIVA
ncbi:unnamed protein product [Prorocentrum cordatum]|uniref:Uncharacterized protein n=1 Tax=Prorocentrum cordatum TaxID=2364126 RepID=A0ABN9T7Q5_9DINO|nr:unnamed protein product [Polarella glacialis]